MSDTSDSQRGEKAGAEPIADLAAFAADIGKASVAMATTVSHQGFLLMGAGFVVFRIVFIILMSNDSWFNFDLNYFSIPTVIVSLAIAHFLLIWLESDSGCDFFRFWRKGQPLLSYRKWATLDRDDLDPGITVGLDHVVWNVIDDLELSFLGNLVFRTRALSGSKRAGERPGFFSRKAPGQAQVILKLGFGSTSLSNQKLLIEAVRLHNPQATLNARLKKALEAKDVKGAQLIQSIGSIYLLVVLFDVGYACFNYLETLKDYYLCRKAAQSGQMNSLAESVKYYERALNLYEHPLPFSWVTHQLFRQGKTAAEILESQSDALWDMGRKDDAIAVATKAVEFDSKDFRLHLRLARFQSMAGKEAQARAEVDQAISIHKHTFLPQLYMLSVVAAGNDSNAQVASLYKIYRDQVDDDMFPAELVWPPVGRAYIADVWYREDLHFVFNRLLEKNLIKP